MAWTVLCEAAHSLRSHSLPSCRYSPVFALCNNCYCSGNSSPLQSYGHTITLIWTHLAPVWTVLVGIHTTHSHLNCLVHSAGP